MARLILQLEYDLGDAEDYMEMSGNLEALKECFFQSDALLMDCEIVGAEIRREDP